MTTELGDFLRTRRAGLRPTEAGLVSYGTRRVPGLRREELAQLAGVSHTYYARLEQGQSSHASDSVLDALARALQLSADEQAHLHNLAKPPAGTAKRRRAEHVRPETRQLVHAISEVPVVVLDRRNDVLAWNPIAHALLAGHLDPASVERPEARPNLLRMLFLDAHTRELYARWDDEARTAVASLRLTSGQWPDDEPLAGLVGELAIKSPAFAALWARHTVKSCTNGTKHLRHPEVGELQLAYTVVQLADGSGHRLLMHSAEPGSGSQAALTLLGLRLT